MTLSERQLQAQSLTYELQRMGAFVISPAPLRDDANLRFQVLDDDRDFVLAKLATWNWSPILCGTVPRFTPRGPSPATTYEINLPRPRQQVPDDRKIPRGELSEKAMNAELEAFKKLRL